MTVIKISASKVYDVLIDKGILQRSGEVAAGVTGTCRAMLVSDDNVYPLYGEAVAASFRRAGFTVSSYIFGNGEKSKNLNVAAGLLEALAAHRFARNDIILALGGGVVGDLAGFAASIYLRGIRYIQIPTTLLAAVDSSVGGKTGVDLAAGKNLAGCFWQPSLVICDILTFDTLSAAYYADGVAEAIKYGVIADAPLFNLLALHNIKESCEEIVARCVGIKRDIVQADELDRGERQLLNFGHTVGHAIEAVSSYKITHGHAVAAGMACITRAAERAGLVKAPCADKLSALIKSYSLPTLFEYNAKELCRAALSDKKIKGDTITLVIPERIGKAVLYKLPTNKLEAFIASGLLPE